LRFADNCPASNGFWHASEDPRPSLSTDADKAVRWSPSEPVIIHTIAPRGSNEAGEYLVPPFFGVLFATDRETILYQGQFVLVTPPAGGQRLELKVLLDCSNVPYRNVGAPDTAASHGGASTATVLGLLALLAAAALTARRAVTDLRPKASPPSRARQRLRP
jgi:hypothetical protein